MLLQFTTTSSQTQLGPGAGDNATYLSTWSVTTFSRLDVASSCAYGDWELSRIACTTRGHSKSARAYGGDVKCAAARVVVIIISSSLDGMVCTEPL